MVCRKLTVAELIKALPLSDLKNTKLIQKNPLHNDLFQLLYSYWLSSQWV
jgi:hypothetical protein